MSDIDQQTFKVFISYSRQDELFARRLANWLNKGGLQVWIDREDIDSGKKWSSAIQEGLEQSEIMILLISEPAMQSVNVEDEWQYFLDKDKVIIPLLLEEVEIPYQLRRIQYIDFSRKGQFAKAKQRLKAEIRKAIARKRYPRRKRQQVTKDTQSADLWPDRRRNYLLGGFISFLTLIVVMGSLYWNWELRLLHVELPVAMSEEIHGVVQFLTTRKTALMSTTLNPDLNPANDNEPVIDGNKIISQTSIVRVAMQPQAQAVLRRNTVATFLNLSNTNFPLEIDVESGRILGSTSGIFPSIEFNTRNGATFRAIGSIIAVDKNTENLTVTYYCYEGVCQIEDSVGNIIVLSEHHQITVTGQANDFNFTAISDVIPINASEYEEWQRLCQRCLDETEIVAQADSRPAQIIPPTSTVTDTPTPTATATPTTAPTSTATATPTITPSPTITSTSTLDPEEENTLFYPDDLYNTIWLLDWDMLVGELLESRLSGEEHESCGTFVSPPDTYSYADSSSSVLVTFLELPENPYDDEVLNPIFFDRPLLVSRGVTARPAHIMGSTYVGNVQFPFVLNYGNYYSDYQDEMSEDDRPEVNVTFIDSQHFEFVESRLAEYGWSDCYQAQGTGTQIIDFQQWEVIGDPSESATGMCSDEFGGLLPYYREMTTFYIGHDADNNLAILQALNEDGQLVSTSDILVDGGYEPGLFGVAGTGEPLGLMAPMNSANGAYQLQPLGEDTYVASWGITYLIRHEYTLQFLSDDMLRIVTHLTPYESSYSYLTQVDCTLTSIARRIGT
ncbi:MAG: toll/interleukin-1 receptor domain-containing protein [Chloroflexota bacterium]